MWKMQGSVVISALALAASVVNGQNEGCGLAVLDKCYRGFPLNGSTPDILVETVGEIPSVEECQWFCKELYSGECTWFAFDSQTNQCNIFKGSITDYTSSCELVGYPKEPNVADCSTTLTGDDACYNFREGYCRFEDYVILENLQFVQSLEHCQEACRHRPDCKFFLYEEKDKICHLEGSQKRNCDVVHGLPNPPFGDCLSANKIPFTVHGSLNATSAMSTTAVGIPTTESGESLADKQAACLNLQGGHLKDGANADGQYCWIKNWHNGGGIRYDYDQGKAICEDLGGNLVVIKTIEVHRKILEGKCSLLDTLWPGKDSCSMGGAFLGIQRDPITSDTSFKWVDGSLVPAATTSVGNFSNWYTDGSPRDASSGKHCVMFMHNRDGQTPRAPYGWTDPESGWDGDYIRGAWQSHLCNTRDRVVCDLSS